MFYKCCDELHEKGETWETFKQAFRQRYRETHTDQYHFTQLQMARQARNESPQQFADRCRSLARKVMLQSADPQIQSIHKENADRMLLASFVSGLGGLVGHHVRILCPRSLPEDLNLALAVQEAERQERSNGSFYAKKNRYDHCPNPMTDSIRSTEIVGIRRNTCAVSDKVPLIVRTKWSSRKLGKRNPKLPFAVTNAMVEVI